jgi:hypothetical protein
MERLRRIRISAVKQALVFTKPINSRIFGNSEPEVPFEEVCCSWTLPALPHTSIQPGLLVGPGDAPHGNRRSSKCGNAGLARPVAEVLSPGRAAAQIENQLQHCREAWTACHASLAMSGTRAKAAIGSAHGA